MFHKLAILGLIFLVGCSSAQGDSKNDMAAKRPKPKPRPQQRASDKVPVVLAKDTTEVKREAKRPSSGSTRSSRRARPIAI